MSGVYDLEGARKAGIKDEDSLNHLASTLNYDLEGARAAGISDADSLAHLAAVKPPPEPVVEKESPEALGGMGATLGGIAAAGDVIYSKGRPIFRLAEKALGMDSSEPTVKPRTFKSPSEIAELAIQRRTVPDVPEGSTTTVRNWTAGKPGEGAGQHAGEFLGGSDYSEADKIAKEAKEFEARNPGKKILPGSLLAVPEEEAARVAKQRAELKATQDIANQAEINALAQKRAERLGERAALKGQQNKFAMGKGAASLVGKAALPVLGGYEVGSQGAQAYNRLTRPDLTASDVASGITNIVGAGAGATSMVPGKYRIPAAILAQGAGAVANWLDKRNPRNEEEPAKKAEGGLAHLAKGGDVAKKLFAPVATKILKASEALGPHEGKWLNVTQSDRMRSTGGDLGGPGFSKFQLERPEYAEAKAAWGVGQKPTASGIVNVNKRFPEGQAIWTPMIGSETQHHSNQHVYDALTEEFNRQARMGNLPKELQERINLRLANAPATKGIFPEDFDIGNPEHLAQYGDTFNRRGAVSTVLSGEGVGGAKGRIIDYPGIMQEMTDPMTIGAPTHSMGTRLFTLNNEIEHRPDLHSAFPYILKGEDQGVAFAPVPKELGIQDFINQFREFKGREPGYYDLVRTTPSQQITEKYLRSLEAAGHADGGSISADDLPDVRLDVRGMPNMTGMPGVGYMQTPQGAMARIEMAKELANARLRAGASGLAMSLPGQHGVKTMPGQLDIGANIPVGDGNVDISAFRSINPMPGRGHMQGANVRYTLPFASGGKVGALTNLLKHVEQQMGKRAALRVEKAADLVPNLERKYSESALRNAFAGDNNRPLMVMLPSKFEDFAEPVIGKDQEYLNYLQTVAQSGGFKDVPYLQLGINKSNIPEIMGHEGRHRSAALAQMGDEPSLVRLMPTSQIDKDIPRNKMIGDYLDAWEKQHGQNILVKPELNHLYEDRQLIQLPETFKKGGLAQLLSVTLAIPALRSKRKIGSPRWWSGHNTDHFGHCGLPVLFFNQE